MSAEDDLKRIEKIADAITLKIVKTLFKETARGAYYAIVGDIVRQKLPGLLRSGKSDQEILTELLSEIRQAKIQPSPSQEQAVEQQLRSIVREELEKALRGNIVAPVQAQSPAQAVSAHPVSNRPKPLPAVADVNSQLKEIDEEILHYKKLLHIIEERRARGDISEEEYAKLSQEYQEKIKALKLKKQRLTAIV